MKYLIALCVFVSLLACKSKDETLPPDSLYHVTTKWENQNGESTQFKDYEGKVLVTSMIFTSCKTACPQLTIEMRNIHKRVGTENQDKVQYMLISIDPKTDKPQLMKAYLNDNKFDGKEWVFIRGSEAETREIANIMAVKYQEISPMDFSHSNIISVYDQKGVLYHQKEGLHTNTDQTVKAVHELLN